MKKVGDQNVTRNTVEYDTCCGLNIKARRNTNDSLDAITEEVEHTSDTGSARCTRVGNVYTGKCLRTQSGNSILDFDLKQLSEYGLEIKTEPSQHGEPTRTNRSNRHSSLRRSSSHATYSGIGLRTLSGNSILDFDVPQLRNYGLKVLTEPLGKGEHQKTDMFESGTCLKTSSLDSLLDFDVLQLSEYGMKIKTGSSTIGCKKTECGLLSFRSASGASIPEWDVLQLRGYGLEIKTERSSHGKSKQT